MVEAYAAQPCDKRETSCSEISMLTNGSILDTLPIWAFFPLAILFSAVAAEIGFRLSKLRPSCNDGAADPSVGSIVGASLALLAFMLGFTFSIAMNRFDQRLKYVVDESNAIGTAYLRADILEEPSRTAVKDLLRNYTHLRLEVAQDPGQFELALSKSRTFQTKLWAQAAKAGQTHPNWPAYTLSIASINEVIDMQSKRLAAALYSRVPTVVWSTLLTVAALAIGATGYFCGMNGKRHIMEVACLTLSFATVFVLLVDLDRPWGGSLRTPQQPLIELYESIKC